MGIHFFRISPKMLVHNSVVLRFTFHISEHFHPIHFEDLHLPLVSTKPLVHCFPDYMLTPGKCTEVSFEGFGLWVC